MLRPVGRRLNPFARVPWLNRRRDRQQSGRNEALHQWRRILNAGSVDDLEPHFAQSGSAGIMVAEGSHRLGRFRLARLWIQFSRLVQTSMEIKRPSATAPVSVGWSQIGPRSVVCLIARPSCGPANNSAFPDAVLARLEGRGGCPPVPIELPCVSRRGRRQLS